MKVKTYIFVILSYLITTTTVAKTNEPIVATIGDTPIYQSEFIAAYEKSAKQNKKQLLGVNEFLDNYINFRLKALEAKSRKIDQTTSFKDEYSQYLEQLERPYLEDSIISIDWIKELYDRHKTDIEIVDLFIPFTESETHYLYPKDTIAAFALSKEIRQKIGKDGNNFEKIAQQYSTSDDSKTSPTILGHKRWITSLMTEQQYEDQVYTLQIGEVSEPIRTRFGYYILKVLNKRPNNGWVGLSNLILEYPENPTPRQKDSINNLAQQIHDKLVKGADFKSTYLAYSSRPDIVTIGDIGYFGTKRPLRAEYMNAIKGIRPVGYTKPLFWDDQVHIVQVKDSLHQGSWSEMKEQLVRRLKQADYVNTLKSHEIESIQSEIPYNLNTRTYDKLQQIAENTSPCDTLFGIQAESLSEENLLTVNGVQYTVADFRTFFEPNEKEVCSIFKLSTDALRYAVNNYIYDKLQYFRKSILFDKYPELKTLADESYNSLLYFNIMSESVWDKAQQDKKGLKQYHQKNRAKYTWDEPRYEGYLLFVKDEDTKSKAKSLIEKNTNSKNLDSILKDELNQNGEINILIEKGLWTKGNNSYIDEIVYGIPSAKSVVGYPYYFFEGVKIDQPRNLNDVRGPVVSDYQDELDKTWSNKLENKYKIAVNKDVVQKIVDRYN